MPITVENPPTAPKSDFVMENGYSPEHFDDAYWLGGSPGEERISRTGDQVVKMVQILIRLEILSKSPHILDIGAGAGSYVKSIRNAGFNCDGCEYSKSGRDLALSKFGITLHECDLRDRIHLPSEQFDYAFCTGVMTMIPKRHLTNAVKEISRILKPSGLLMVNLSNPNPRKAEPHLTLLHHNEWRTLFCEGSPRLFDDVTSLCQPGKVGIGVLREFCGLFRRVS